jgi:hypothetical protein
LSRHSGSNIFRFISDQLAAHFARALKDGYVSSPLTRPAVEAETAQFESDVSSIKVSAAPKKLADEI